MHSLKDAQYAMNGEPKSQEQKYEFQPKRVFKAKEKKEKGFVVFKLYKNDRRGGVFIPYIDYAIDPRTITDEKPHGDGPEMIRLLRGVPTIWAKEQKNLTPEYIKKNARYIEWPMGTKFKTVPVHDVTMLEFMRVCRHNVKNENRTSGSKTEFFEYDPSEVAKERLQKEHLEMVAIIKANSVPFDEMKKHAFYLKVSLTNELGLPRDEGQLRPEYMIAAKRNPKLFMETIGSKEVEINFLVRSAIIENKIDISRKDGHIHWANGGLICTCPKKEDAIEVLSQFALSKTKDGEEFLNHLKRITT